MVLKIKESLVTITTVKTKLKVLENAKLKCIWDKINIYVSRKFFAIYKSLLLPVE